jgi:DNA modification methylase
MEELFMELDKIYNEDCRVTLKREELRFDYVFTSPPDFSELNLDPVKDRDEYYKFLDEVITGLTNKCDLITISMSDRKFDGGIMTKHMDVARIFEEKGFRILTYKIWCKSENPTCNLYRMGFSNVITYARKGVKIKQNGFKPFKPDVYFKNDKGYKGYSYGLPEELAEIHIMNFTQEGQIVFDPFSGSGTIPASAKMNKRYYSGSEICEDYYKLGQVRLFDVPDWYK